MRVKDNELGYKGASEYFGIIEWWGQKLLQVVEKDQTKVTGYCFICLKPDES